MHAASQLFVEAFEVYQRITPAEILAYIAGRS
jgi:hypothetical protein